jgi:hypothetical protein
MSFFLYATNLLLIVSFVVFVRQVVRAPEGHEDETGFHFGAQAPVRAARRSSPVRRTKGTPAYAKITTRHVAA